MARFRKPFFRPDRCLWYVWHNGKQVNLGADKDAAITAWHRLRATPSAPIVTQTQAQKLVVVIVDEFLEWCEKHRATDTYWWYKDRLNSFCKTIDPTLAADQLKPNHVQSGWITTACR